MVIATLILATRLAPGPGHQGRGTMVPTFIGNPVWPRALGCRPAAPASGATGSPVIFQSDHHEMPHDRDQVLAGDAVESVRVSRP